MTSGIHFHLKIIENYQSLNIHFVIYLNNQTLHLLKNQILIKIYLNYFFKTKYFQ